MYSALTSSSSNLLKATDAGDYFVVSSSDTDSGSGKDVVFSGIVSSVGNAETIELTGRREILLSDTYESPLSLTATFSPAGTVSVYKIGTAAEGRIILGTNPTNGLLLTLGLAGFETPYKFVTALADPYDVLIGATVNDTAVNLRRAIRGGNTVIGDATGEGTLYGTGTVANPYVTVSAISNTILTLQDRIACKRVLAYVLTSDTDASLQAPISGANGVLIATVTSALLVASEDISLDNAAMTDNFPPLFTFVSNWVSVREAPSILRLRVGAVASGLTCSYETDARGDGDIDAGMTAVAALDDELRIVEPAEKYFNRIRVTIVNPNTDPAAVHGLVIGAR